MPGHPNDDHELDPEPLGDIVWRCRTCGMMVSTDEVVAKLLEDFRALRQDVDDLHNA